jgi:hypothetical protein
MRRLAIQNLPCLNHMVVSHIETGHYEDAISLSFESLSLVSKLLKDKIFGIMPDPGYAASMETLQTLIQQYCSKGIKLHPHHKDSFSQSVPSFSRCTKRQSAQDLLFERPLFISLQFSLDMFAFVTLYNLALATHLNAVTPQDTCFAREKLEKTLELWEIVYSLQWREDCQLSSVHTLAILANLGHVNLLLGNAMSSKECYRRLLTTLEFTRHNDDKKVDYQSFFIHAAYSMLSPGQAAAAA